MTARRTVTVPGGMLWSRSAGVLVALVAAVSLGTVGAAASVRGSGSAAAFGAGGIVRTDLGGDDRVSALLAQPDGRIVAVGARGTDFALVRYLQDGRLDISFGAGGKVVTHLGSGGPADSSSYRGTVAALLQRDGKIVAAGGLRQFVLVRYLRDGRLDPSFGRGGIVRTSIRDRGCLGAPPRGELATLALQADGKIVAAGGSCGDVAIVRYLASGRLDASFGRNGKLVTYMGGGNDFSSVKALVVRPDGELIAAVAQFPRMGGGAVIAGFTSRGRRDLRFGRGGEARWFNDVSALALQADGGILVAAEENVEDESGGAWVYELVRFRATGKIDLSFGRRGTALTGSMLASSIAIKPDGMIVVAGGNFGSPGSAIARYTNAGNLDVGFGTNGTQPTPVSLAPDARLALRQDGKIVVSTSTGAAHKHDFMLIRYTPDGRIDS